MFYLIALFIMLPSLAWAGNVNIPTIVLTERLMGLSFVLIVGLEAFILRRYLQGLNNKKALFISLKSNLITMLLVIPLVWISWGTILINIKPLYKIFIELVSTSANLNKEIVINILSAPLVGKQHSLLIAEWAMAPVYFIASYYLEYWFSRQKLKDFDSVQIKKAFFYANLYSYLMIMIFETVYQFIIMPYKATNPYLF